jgi:hypothetical protein
MAGWDELDAVPTVADAPPAHDMDRLCLRVFGTEEGQKLFKWLRDQTVEQSCWSPGAEASYGYFLEGRCSLVKEIEARINRARNI